MKKVKIFRIAKITGVALFLALVPWAIYYNLSFDRYGTIDRPTPPTFIQIVTVDVGGFNNTLKTNAAKYSSQFDDVRIFVLPMTNEQVGTQEFDIRIIRDGDVLHAFISPTQTKVATQHCKDFLDKIAQEHTNLKIHIG